MAAENKARKRHLYIGRAHGGSTGIMQCAACCKAIPLDANGFAAEDYAYYETSAAYVNFHRKCSEANPAWAKYDAARKADMKQRREFQDDCRAFHAKWGVTDFTDEAEEMGLI